MISSKVTTRTKGVLAALSFAAVFHCSNAHADTVFWTNSTGTGLWSNPNNWSTGAIPTAGDDVLFVGNGASVLDINISIRDLTIQGSYDDIVTVAANLNAAHATLEGSLFVGGLGHASFAAGAVIGDGGRMRVITASTATFAMGVDVLGGGVLEANTASLLTFGAGSTSSIEAGGSISIDGGSPSTNVVLRSSLPGLQWFFDLELGSNSFFQYADVRDSDANGGFTAVAVSSVNSGNNENWLFLSTAPVPEPETYALLLAGLGLLGLVAQRRRKLPRAV